MRVDFTARPPRASRACAPLEQRALLVPRASRASCSSQARAPLEQRALLNTSSAMCASPARFLSTLPRLHTLCPLFDSLRQPTRPASNSPKFSLTTSHSALYERFFRTSSPHCAPLSSLCPSAFAPRPLLGAFQPCPPIGRGHATPPPLPFLASETGR